MATSLSNLITRMNVWTPIYNMDEVRKVNALDQSIRMFRLNSQPPWVLKKRTLRIFKDVFQYPVAVDHEQLAFLNDQNLNEQFFQQPRYIFTSLKDFIENPTYRNYVAEIWQNGVKTLGVRNKTNPGLTSLTMESAESVSGWTTSGDAGTPVLDDVNFITGNASIRVPITNSSNTATITTTFTGFNDANYQRMYQFRWVYFDGLPTSCTLRCGTSATQYLQGTVTTQFAGQPFIEDDWNLLAFDLDTATNVGSFNGEFAWQSIILTGAPTGTYYFDASYLRGWVLQDYWYYSKYNVLVGSTQQEFFSSDGANYDITSELIGDTIWHEAIIYEACLYLLADQKENNIYKEVNEYRQRSWSQFFGRYPDLSPHINTNIYRFGTDYSYEMGWYNDVNYG